MKKEKFEQLIKIIANKSYEFEDLKIGVNEFDEESIGEELDNVQVAMLVDVLKQNPKIKKLDLSYNHIGDEGAIALSTLGSIEDLNLSYNNITPIGFKALADGKFKCLDLTQYIYTGELVVDEMEYKILKDMIDSFIQNKTITHLTIGNWKVSSNIIAQLIKNNTCIETLIMSRYTTDEVFEFIEENKFLKTLNIMSALVTDKGIEYIVKNMSLDNLYLNGCNITNIGAQLLSTNHTLKKLYIYDSDITLKGTECFLNSDLEKFNISTNLKQYIISKGECDNFNHMFEEARKLKHVTLHQVSNTQNFNHETLNDNNHIDLNGKSDAHQDE